MLAGKSGPDREVAALAAAVEADQARLDELAGLYAEGVISAREWIAARDPITARITQNRRAIAAASDTTAIYGLAGTGGILRDQWPDLDLDRRQAIIKAVLDHAVIAPGVPVPVAWTSTACNRAGASRPKFPLAW